MSDAAVPPVAVECIIPTVAAATIDLESIRYRARGAIIGPSLEFSTEKVGLGQVRVTTDTRLAPFIADQLHDRVAGDDDEVAVACALAIGALLNAIDDALFAVERERRRGEERSGR